MLKIVPFVVPAMLPYTIPATLLLTVCVVYGRMAGDLEITATKAAGINVFVLIKPAFIMAAVLSGFSLFLTDQVIPWAEANIQRIVTSAMEDIFLGMLRTNHQVTDDQHGFDITVMGVDGKKLLMPTFHYTRPGHSPAKLQAQEATLEFDLENQQLILHMVRGTIETPGNRRISFERETQKFPLPSRIQQTKARHMSVREIRTKMDAIGEKLEDIRTRRDVETILALTHGDFDRLSNASFAQDETSLRMDGKVFSKLNTEMHSRLALSTSCFFFVLIGAPISILKAHRQFLTTFMFCFVPILVLYYPVVMLMMNMSKSGTIAPLYAMWVGNILLLIVGSYYLRKVLKH
jgi:lipopolysaccharide export system permease protein